MTNFAQFLKHGNVGELSLGLSKEETIRRLGTPREWLGLPGTIGPTVPSPEHSDVWFYYNAVGIHFDENEIAVEIHVNPEKIVHIQSPFCEWPIDVGSRMKVLREFLLEEGIGFDESNADADNYWIATTTHCFATSWWPGGGRWPLGPDRKISLIQKFPDAIEVNRLRRMLS